MVPKKSQVKDKKDLFWADQIASQVIARAEREKNQVTCKSAASTSGAKHIGNLYDVMKTYIVYKAVKRKKYPARIILIHDDRDPLRTVPLRLPGLDGKWEEIKGDMEKAISVYLGFPYFKIPDPFECCDSWSEHFARVWEDGIEAMGVKEIETYSSNDLYNEGKMEPYIIKLMENIELTRKIIQRFQKTKTADYIPFDAICENCGRIIGKAVSFNLKNKTVDYVCEGKSLAGKYTIEGCGHKGTASFNDGKLPWTFEWPSRCAIFKATFEPFGKEHAEGSWPRCQVIAREVFGIEPPIPHIYEFLLINGEKMSARKGNAYITQEILDIIEPEIFFYFYTKRSKKQRDLDIKNIHLLVEDFEHAERVYFNLEEEKNLKEKENLKRMYETSMSEIPKSPPVRIPYNFAALIAEECPYDMLGRALELLKASGHMKVSTEEDLIRIKERLQLAKNWIEKFAPELRIKINDTVPEGIKNKLNEQQKESIRALAKVLKSDLTEEQLTNELYSIAKKTELNKEFFKACYNVLITRDSGPRLASFIIAVGRDRVKKIFDQV
jgi:lysyl-tRNA synthetase class 1